MKIPTFLKISFSLIIVSILFLTGCKKDEEVISSAIVGVWKEKPSTEQMIFTFNSNGIGTYQMKNTNTNQIIESESFTYTFDTQTNKLTTSQFGISYAKIISSTSIQLYHDVAYTDEWTFVMNKQ